MRERGDFGVFCITQTANFRALAALRKHLGQGYFPMWQRFKNALLQSEPVVALLGGVVFECRARQGLTQNSLLQWRVKRTGSGSDRRLYLGLKVVADASIRLGEIGVPTGYINFELATARQIRDDLDECIKALEAEKERNPT